MEELPLKILLIEDNPGDVLILQETLAGGDFNKFTITNATSLADAFDMLDVNTFDLILLDLSLPDEQGLDTLLRTRIYAHDSPIIVLTGISNEEIGNKAITAGAQDYLVKGQFDNKLLWRSIRYSTQRHKMLMELEKIRQRELRISESRYRAIVEDQTEFICRFLPDKTITFVNQALCRYIGKKADDIIGKSFLTLVPPHYHEIIRKNIDSLEPGVPITTHEYSVSLSHDDIRWQQWVNRAIFDEYGIIKEFQAVGVDITDRKRAEDELHKINDSLESRVRERTFELARANRELQKEIAIRKAAEDSLASEKERLMTTLRSIGEGVISVDTQMKVVLMNPVASEITGFAGSEALGRDLETILKMLNSQTRAPIENPARNSIDRGEVIGLGNHVMVLSKNSKEIFISATSAPIRDNTNAIIGAILVFRDITEQKKIEEELLKVNKLESLSLMASGLAHDFNNFLTGIIGNISLAKLLTSPENKMFKILTNAEEVSFQAKELTNQLLTVAKGGTPHKKVTDVTELLKNSTNFMSRGSNVLCDFKISPNLWKVKVDTGQLNQVISNLVLNAIQAMPNGGKIFVNAENVTLRGAGPLPFKPGKYIKISVCDTGTGIPQKNLDKIFDPYFTTKAKGNGLGLASAYSIVKNHEGIFTVESKVDIGTSFHIYIPAIFENDKTETLQPAENAPAEKISKCRGKILIMDDEETIREISCQLLTHMGFETHAVKDGAEAVEVYKNAREAGNAFDLLIMDLTVPGGMGGADALKKIMQFAPDVKAIAASGYFNDHEVVSNYKENGFMAFITKPYKIQELVKVAQDIISGTPSAV